MLHQNFEGKKLFFNIYFRFTLIINKKPNSNKQIMKYIDQKVFQIFVPPTIQPHTNLSQHLILRYNILLQFN